jgi:hypothetical protein
MPLGCCLSWKGLVQHYAAPASSDDYDVDLTAVQADYLVRSQLRTLTPPYLSEEAFFMAGVAGSRQLSRRVHAALARHGLIAPPPPSPQQQSFGQPVPPVNTASISSHFVRQLSIISLHAQRRLIGLLFFWEEECTRWKLLDQEQSDILTAMSYTDSDDLELALRAVEMKRVLLPSRRAESTANVSRGVGHELPLYSR